MNKEGAVGFPHLTHKYVDFSQTAGYLLPSVFGLKAYDDDDNYKLENIHIAFDRIKIFKLSKC